MSLAVILLALLAAVLIVVYIFRPRGGQGTADETPAAEERGPDTVVGTSVRISQPGARPRQEEFDPTATQVYMRPNPDEAPPAAHRHDGAAPRRIQSARLVGLSGSLKGRSYDVPAAGITIGRAAACDVVLADPRISSRHAWIGLVDGKAVLKDLGSTNGTFLNAHTRSTISETELCSGDTISVGGHQGDQFRIVLG